MSFPAPPTLCFALSIRSPALFFFLGDSAALWKNLKVIIQMNDETWALVLMFHPSEKAGDIAAYSWRTQPRVSTTTVATYFLGCMSAKTPQTARSLLCSTLKWASKKKCFHVISKFLTGRFWFFPPVFNEQQLIIIKKKTLYWTFLRITW